MISLYNEHILHCKCGGGGGLVANLYLTLCNPKDCSQPGSSVHGISQNGLPFPSPGDLPNPRIEFKSPALAGGFFTTEPTGKPAQKVYYELKITLSPQSCGPLEDKPRERQTETERPRERDMPWILNILLVGLIRQALKGSSRSLILVRVPPLSQLCGLDLIWNPI